MTQSPHNVFVQRYYYLMKGLGVFSRKAVTGTNSEAIFRSIEEQATQSVWWDGELAFSCQGAQPALRGVALRRHFSATATMPNHINAPSPRPQRSSCRATG